MQETQASSQYDPISESKAKEQGASHRKITTEMTVLSMFVTDYVMPSGLKTRRFIQPQSRKTIPVEQQH